MLKRWFNTASSQPNHALDIIRVVIAFILLVHSVYRIFLGAVPGFGEFLGSIGFPFGVVLAWFITLFTLVCSIAMIIRRMVALACIGHICVLVPGIWIEHASHGWFVVGGGRNGMEYSVTLIACLFAILWTYWPRNNGRISNTVLENDLLRH